MMNAVTDIRMDKEAFYRWAERQEGRFELVDGHPTMMNGVTRNHARVAANLVEALFRRIDRDSLELTFSDFAVEIGDTVRYPDIMVSVREPDGRARRATMPVVLIEILSEHSLQIDLDDKATEYTSLPTVSTYAVFSQDSASAWVWSRTREGMPSAPLVLASLDAVVTIPALDLSVSLAEVYRGVALG